MNYKFKKISGDASFRDFYRVKKNKKTSIIVFAKKEKFKNLPNVQYQDSIERAINSISLGEGDLLLITGSLYLCAEVLDLN